MDALSREYFVPRQRDRLSLQVRTADHDIRLLEECLTHHPLGRATVGAPSSSSSAEGSRGSGPSAEGGHPLEALEEGEVLEEGFDPLSGFSQQSRVSAGFGGRLEAAGTIPDIPTRVDRSGEKSGPKVPMWDPFKMDILARYSTAKHIPVSSKILDENAGGEGHSKSVDTTKARLERLELSHSEAKEYMTQQEYIKHIEFLNEELEIAWEREERVRALKLVIQAAKLLGETANLQFYPSMYTLVTRVLDTFGHLVFTRIFQKAMEDSETASLSLFLDAENFTYHDVNIESKETCHNWFFKIASIRELLPRIYVETAVLRCYRFIVPEEKYIKALHRLARCIRGVGDPLVAAYARAFLVRKGADLISKETAHIVNCFYDTIHTTSLQWRSPSVLQQIESVQMPMRTYVDLYSPAVSWILTCLGALAGKGAFRNTVQGYSEKTNVAMFLNNIILSFDAEEISDSAEHICQLIADADDTCSKATLYISLGSKLVDCPPAKHLRLAILNTAWKAMSTLGDKEEYMKGASIYVKFVLNCFGEKEVNILLGDIRNQFHQEKLSDSIQQRLFSVGKACLESSLGFSSIFAMDNFSPCMAMLRGEYRKSLSKIIFTAFTNQPKTSDPLVVGALLETGRSMHDGVSNLTSEGERNEIIRLLITFIRKVDFQRDLEQQLQFFVDCRRNFSNLDEVVSELVLQTCSLAMRALDIMRGMHNKRTATFCKSCCAYLHITIPSITSALMRLRLYTIAGLVTLQNKLLGQADTLFRLAVRTIKEVTPLEVQYNGEVRSTGAELVQCVQNLACALLVVPADPKEESPLYQLRGLFRTLVKLEWDSDSTPVIEMLLYVLNVSCAMYQEELPYHISDVASNDTLYAGSEALERDSLELARDSLAALSVKIQELGSTTTDHHVLKNLGRVSCLVLDQVCHLATPCPQMGRILGPIVGVVRRSPHNEVQKRMERLIHSLDQESVDCFGL